MALSAPDRTTSPRLHSFMAMLLTAVMLPAWASQTEAGPPGVPTTPGRRVASGPEVDAVKPDSIALIDLRSVPRSLLPVLENIDSVRSAWKPAPRVLKGLELRRLDHWFIVCGPPESVEAFRTWYAATLSTENPPVLFDVRVIELPEEDPEDLLTSIRRDPRGPIVQALATATPDGGRLIADGRITVVPGTTERLEWKDDSGTRTVVEIGLGPGDASEEFEVRIDAETARSRTLGRRTDRVGARASDRRRTTSPGISVATTTGPFADATVRLLDGGRRTLPSAAPGDEPAVVIIATPSAGTIDGLRNTIPSTPYVQVEASRDGIGRLYFDREIAQVMGHFGASWLERPEREREERTELLLSMLPLEAGDTVADIGAGSGYFTRRLSRMVGDEGTVIATDIQPQMLEILESGLLREGIANVEPMLGTITDCGLKPSSVDMILLVDVYHEFDHPWEMSRSMLRALRPDGVVALVEYRADDPGVPIKPLHTMTAEQSRLEFEAAGFTLVGETVGDLPWQRLQLFAGPDRPVE